MKTMTAIVATLVLAMPAVAQDQAPSEQPMQAPPGQTPPAGETPMSNAGTVTRDDFISGAASGGMYEVQSSQLILEQTQNDGIRQLAQMLIDDHGKAGAELKSIVEAEGGTVPADLMPKHADMVTQLKQAAAGTADDTYLQQQLAAHQEAIALFTGYSQSGDDQQLKDFAAKTLPTLQHHLEAVQQLQAGG